MSPQLLNVEERAQQEPEERFHSQAHLIDVSALERAFGRSRKGTPWAWMESRRKNMGRSWSRTSRTCMSAWKQGRQIGSGKAEGDARGSRRQWGACAIDRQVLARGSAGWCGTIQIGVLYRSGVSSVSVVGKRLFILYTRGSTSSAAGLPAS